jgi:hypothetical protein
MNGIKRGDRLRDLVSLGCSIRGLGKELGQSPTSISRHIELSGLPSIDREDVAGGKSAKKILKAKADADRYRRQQKRLQDDRSTGVLSDELADVILEFCRAGKEPIRRPIAKAQVDMFLKRVAEHLLDPSNKPPIRVSKKQGISGLFKLTCPQEESDDVFWFEHQAKWLAEIVRLKAAESEIVVRSFKKVVKRASELSPDDKRTPLQTYKDTKLRRYLLGVSPTRRPEYQTGLRRQGQKSASTPVPSKRRRKS